MVSVRVEVLLVSVGVMGMVWMIKMVISMGGRRRVFGDYGKVPGGGHVPCDCGWAGEGRSVIIGGRDICASIGAGGEVGCHGEMTLQDRERTSFGVGLSVLFAVIEQRGVRTAGTRLKSRYLYRCGK